MTALKTRPRILTASDLGSVHDLLDQDPIVNCVLAARVHAAPDLDAHRLGGYLWGVQDGAGSLRAAVFHGGNLIPVGDDLAALESIASQLVLAPRVCSSMVGPAPSVATLWGVLARRWGPARSVLPNQPFLVTKSLYGVDFDWSVRRVRPSELPNYLPAAIAMFTEELGVSPMSNGSGAGFRARVAELIHAGRAFARFGPRGQVEFKAEIGGLSCDTAQIQGVWVRPELRGRGMGTGAVGAVLDYALDSAPSASLYVNHFNEPARRMYQRLGMRQTRTLATVLF